METFELKILVAILLKSRIFLDLGSLQVISTMRPKEQLHIIMAF